MSDTARGAIYGITAAAIWGGMYVVSDVVLEEIPPFTLLLLRLLLGLLVLWIMLRQSDSVKMPRGRVLWQSLGVGLVGFGVSLGAQLVGTDLSNAVNGSLITSASPAFIVIFAALILHEQLDRRRIAAVSLATLGVVFVINPAEADFGSETFAGDVSLAVAAVSWGLYSVLVRNLSTRVDTLALTILCFIGGLSLTIPAVAIELRQDAIGEIGIGVILGVLYLGIVSTAVAQWMWNRAFKLVDAASASLFFFAQPVVGAALGVVLLGQPFTTMMLIGGVMIAAGVLLKMLAPASEPAEAHIEAV